jgi:hypothetical protein
MRFTGLFFVSLFFASAAAWGMDLGPAPYLAARALFTPEGQKLVSISVVPREEGAISGFLRYSGKPKVPLTRGALVKQVTMMISGGETEWLRTGRRVTGDGPTLSMVSKLFAEYVLDQDLYPGVDFDNPPPNFPPDYEKRLQEVINDAQKIVRPILKRNWPLIMATAEFIAVRGKISAEELEKIKTAALAKASETEALMASGWTKEKAEQIKIDLNTLFPDFPCEDVLTEKPSLK